ncbi:hypothetical protein Tco_1399992 [Tanacetum coccineum]
MVDFVPSHAVTDAAHHKRVKYEAKCANIGYGFLPFSFSSLGELEKDAMNLLKRIRKFSLTQDIEARVAVHIFNRIGFAIAKGVGAQLVIDYYLGPLTMLTKRLISERRVERGLRRRRISGPWWKIFERVKERMRRSVGGGDVKGSGVVLGVVKSSLREKPDGAIGVGGGESRGVEGGAV